MKLWKKIILIVLLIFSLFFTVLIWFTEDRWTECEYGKCETKSFGGPIHAIAAFVLFWFFVSMLWTYFESWSVKQYKQYKKPEEKKKTVIQYKKPQKKE